MINEHNKNPGTTTHINHAKLKVLNCSLFPQNFSLLHTFEVTQEILVLSFVFKAEKCPCCVFLLEYTIKDKLFIR
jgi:hypothetical protein